MTPTRRRAHRHRHADQPFSVEPPAVSLRQRCTRSTSQLYTAAIQFYLKQIGTAARLVRAVDIDLVTDEVCKHRGSDGWCEPIEESCTHFLIAMARKRPLNLRLGILAHECVHVGQFACGQLSRGFDEDGDRCLIWMGRRYPPLLHLHMAGTYELTPWEQEAYRKTDALTNAFMDYGIAKGFIIEEV